MNRWFSSRGWVWCLGLVVACGSSNQTEGPGSGGKNTAGQSPSQGGTAGESFGGGGTEGGFSGEGGGSSGTGGNSGGMGGNSPLTPGALGIAEASLLCNQACATVQTCDGKLDVVTCEGQCVKEVTGEGYLFPEVAVGYFQEFQNKKQDSDCKLTKMYQAWAKWSPDTPPADKYEKLLDQNAMKECMDYMLVCIPINQEVERKASCFDSFYRYNESIRQEKRKCFAQKPCTTSVACFGSSAPSGEPWLAGLSQPLN